MNRLLKQNRLIQIKDLPLFTRRFYCCKKPVNVVSVNKTLILPVIKEIFDTMQEVGISNKKTKSVPLDNDTVSKRIDEMTDNCSGLALYISSN